MARLPERPLLEPSCGGWREPLVPHRPACSTSPYGLGSAGGINAIRSEIATRSGWTTFQPAEVAQFSTGLDILSNRERRDRIGPTPDRRPLWPVRAEAGRPRPIRAAPARSPRGPSDRRPELRPADHGWAAVWLVRPRHLYCGRISSRAPQSRADLFYEVEQRDQPPSQSIGCSGLRKSRKIGANGPSAPRSSNRQKEIATSGARASWGSLRSRAMAVERRRETSAR